MNYVTDLSVSPLTQGGKEVVMTYIAQHSLIPTFNWLLIVEKEYSEYGHSGESLVPLPGSLYYLLISCLWILLQGNMKLP